MDYPWRDADALRDLYYGEELSQHQIAEHWDTSPDVINRWMKRHDIAARDRPEANRVRHNTDEPWKDEAVLRELYVEQRLTQPEIADELGCGDSTISNWIDRLEIKLPWQDEATMRELYVGRGMSQTEIAEHLDCGVSTVEKWMGRHGISGRENGDAVMLAMLPEEAYEILTDKEELRRLYVDQELSSRQIASMLGVGKTTVADRVSKYGLTRTQSEASRIQQLPKDVRDVFGDKDEMRTRYVEDGQSIPDLADEFDVAVRTVADYLELHEIERRSISEAVGTGEDHHSWKGGCHPYGPNWHEQREERLERDDYQCVVCGIGDDEHREANGRGLDVHHVIPLRKFVTDGDLDHTAANALTNLISLCRTCHARWEGIELRPET